MQSKKRRQGKRVCLLCRQAEKSYTPSIRAGLIAMWSICQELHNAAIQSRTRSTVANSQPCAPVYSACNRSMQRGPVWHDASTPQRIHAAPGALCKFAQNRAVQALQNRPISTTHNALQRLYAAISNGFVAFRSTPGSAAQGIPDRPPGVDTLRICAVGVEFS